MTVLYSANVYSLVIKKKEVWFDQLCRAVFPIVLGRFVLMYFRSSFRIASLCLSMSLLHHTKVLTPVTITTTLLENILGAH